MNFTLQEKSLINNYIPGHEPGSPVLITLHFQILLSETVKISNKIPGQARELVS